LKLLRAGRHAVSVEIVAVDQSHRRRRASLSGHCVIGANSTLVTLVIRK